MENTRDTTIVKGWKPEYTQVLIYAEKGLKGCEIAEKLGYSNVHISRIMNSPEFIAKRVKHDDTRIEAARAILNEQAINAALKLAKIANKGKPEDRIQLDAAKEILHMVGLKPIEVIENRKREYSKEELESASIVAKELEEITERLTSRKSHFLVTESNESLQLSAPVPAMLPTEAPIEENTPIAER
jgi:hypothetical protein